MTLKELKDRRDHWRGLADKYIKHAYKKYKEKHPKTVYIKCPLCLDKHALDPYNWTETCRGYMSLADFEMIVKIETGKRVEYAE